MRCGACLRTPLGLDRCVAAVDYAYPWAGIVGQYKFQADPAWAPTLARLLHSTPWAEPLMDAADWVLPIPLSAHRLRNRGFNQALLLARILAQHHLSVQLAKVSTLGERVEDTFLIQGPELQNNARQIQIETELLQELSS